jgi:26S proteasome regulatory subunit N1
MFVKKDFILTSFYYFVQDKLMTAPSDSPSSGSSGNWLFKNKEHGKASAAASLV